jgi:hypothetical protein
MGEKTSAMAPSLIWICANKWELRAVALAPALVAVAQALAQGEPAAHPVQEQALGWDLAQDLAPDNQADLAGRVA